MVTVIVAGFVPFKATVLGAEQLPPGNDAGMMQLPNAIVPAKPFTGRNVSETVPSVPVRPFVTVRLDAVMLKSPPV